MHRSIGDVLQLQKENSSLCLQWSSRGTAAISEKRMKMLRGHVDVTHFVTTAVFELTLGGLHQVGERPLLTPRTPLTGPIRQHLILDEHSDDVIIRCLDEFWKGSLASSLFFLKSTTRNSALHPDILDGLVLIGHRLLAGGAFSDEALFTALCDQRVEDLASSHMVCGGSKTKDPKGLKATIDYSLTLLWTV